MRGPRLVLFLVSFAAWTAVMVVAGFAGDTRGVHALVWAALGVSVLAFLVGVGHGVAGIVRKRREGLAWKEIL